MPSIKKHLLPMLTLLLAGMVFSCEDTIDLDPDFEDSQLVVDAWLTNLSEPQEIRLSTSQPIFDQKLPDPVTNAQVVVTGPSMTYSFEHIEPGVYRWTPEDGQSLGVPGDSFSLSIEVDGNRYSASTTMQPVPPIDSIGLEYEEEELGQEEGYYAQLYARDLPQIGNTYWIRTWRNDTLLNKPQEMVIAYDASSSPGSATNGIVFIFPIRIGINAIDEDGAFQPYSSGDHIRCELRAISNDAWNFLSIAQEQMTNGDNGIFTLPVANTPGNIKPMSGDQEVLGIFDVAATSTDERTID